jgi:glycosyltransferase involved in cell wall biosynthesis
MTNKVNPTHGIRKLVFCSNTAWFLYNFRLDLIKKSIELGFNVVALAPKDSYAEKLSEVGCRFVPINIDNKGVNPIRDLILFFRFLVALYKEKPDLFLAATVKPNVYGSIAAYILSIPTINNITGLGTVFIRKNWVTKVVEFLYKNSLRHSKAVLFENNDDLDIFISEGLAPKKVSRRLPISGVDLDRYHPVERQSDKGDSRIFLLVARMLWDKGIGEFIEAAKLIKIDYPAAQFQLLGFLNVENNTAITRDQISEWEREGIVTYLGSPDDIRPFLADCDCLVLPSYREGLSVALLEAASMAKPIVATNTVGCKDVVIDGITGYLVNVKDSKNLAMHLKKIILHSDAELIEMGKKGRKFMEEQFDNSKIVMAYCDEIEKCIEKSSVQ